MALSLDALIHLPTRRLAVALKHYYPFELQEFLVQLHAEAQKSRHESLRRKAHTRAEELRTYMATRT